MDPIQARIHLLQRAIDNLAAENDELTELHRLHLVLLLRYGLRCSVVADWFGENERTLRRWNKVFEEEGVDGLTSLGSRGRPGKLDMDQLERVRRDLEVSPDSLGHSGGAWNGRLLCDHITRLFGLKLSLRQCQRLLQSLLGDTGEDRQRNWVFF